MAHKHKYAGAKVSISTKLEPATISELCGAAVHNAETLQINSNQETSTPDRLVYTFRNRITGGRITFMTFQVTLRKVGDLHQVQTQIVSYRQKRQWLLVIPLPWEMIAWKPYRDFMYDLARSIQSKDATSVATVVELVDQPQN